MLRSRLRERVFASQPTRYNIKSTSMNHLSLRRFLHLLGALLTCIAALPLPKANAADTASPSPLKLRAMSFNLRYASQKPPNSWPERRPIMKRAIEKLAPDVFGTQEGVYPQLKDLASDIPTYEWIGLGRDGGSRGEFMAIFYKRDRFEPIAYDHFWLSDTPEVIASTTWGHSNRRMVTWVRFRDKSSNREFFFWNTHFDHQIEPARQKAAALIHERIAKLPTDVPLILVGDFNCAGGNSKAYDTLTKDAHLTDSWVVAKERINERLNSFNDFKPAREEGIRIDWILFRGNAQVSTTQISNYAENNQFPSDHFPITADLSFP